MAHFCCPITPFHLRSKRRLPQRARGVNVVLTRRAYAGVHSYLKELHMEQPGDYCITYNGALVQKAEMAVL
jgi:hydroxymethylpyrimidine pyrophosphatase-like HAD family hydrolase